jgi:cytoskeletal protein RodZ
VHRPLTIDNDFRKPFEGVVNEVRRRNTATGDDRVTRKTLKTKRDSQRISLRQVADATRIREAVLSAIEEDRYEDLPHIYVKSFLSAYAKCLGLNPTEVIMIHQKYVKKLSFSKSQVSKHPSAFRRKRVNVQLLVISISALLFAVIVAYASFKLLHWVLPFF